MNEREREVLAEIVTHPGQSIRELRKSLDARFFVGLTINELESRNYIKGKAAINSDIQWFPTTKGEAKLRGDEADA